MRLPVQSEPDAFRIAYGFALLVGVSSLLGALTEPVIGAALFTAVALAALVWDLTTSDPGKRAPLREASHEPHPEAADGAWRVLVVANESLEGDGLRDELRRRAKLRPELVVLAPVLLSKTHWTVSDVDREVEEAHRRLDTTLAWARQQGLAARGEVGDPNDSFASIEDELRRFGADEVIVATHPTERQNWVEGGMLERLREELDIPVTHVVVDREQHRVEVDPPG